MCEATSEIEAKCAACNVDMKKVEEVSEVVPDATVAEEVVEESKE